MNTGQIARAAERHGITIPDEITAADELARATEAYRQAVFGEPRPDLSGLTVDTIAAHVAAMTTWQTREARGKAATDVAGHAQLEATRAWHAAVPWLFEAFRGPYDTAVRAFTDAAATLGPAGVADADAALAAGHGKARTTLLAAGAALTDLIAVRDELATAARADVDRVYDAITRVATLPDKDSLHSVNVRAGSLRRGTVEWLVALLSIDGLALRWQTPAEQVEHVAQLRRRSTAYTADASA